MQSTKDMFDFLFPGQRVFRYQAMDDILHHLVTTYFRNSYDRSSYREESLMSHRGRAQLTCSKRVTDDTGGDNRVYYDVEG